MRTIFDHIRKATLMGINFIVDSILCGIFLLLPKRKIILIESTPDFSDSPREIFDEMIRRGLNNEYLFVWYLNDEVQNFPNIKNVKYIYPKKQRVVFRYYECVSMCLISSNNFLHARSKRQVSYYISHGSTLKAAGKYYVLPKQVNYYLSASEHAGKIISRMMHIPEYKEVFLGLPRNDEFSRPVKDTHCLFSQEFEKMIVWYPTYRQHKAGYNNSNSKNALPILHDEESVVLLNQIAVDNKTLIVLKPHFAQDVNYIKNLALSNIIFIDDSFLQKNKITSYELVHAADALISDYSSIYYDYLLANKPIMLVWEDIEEYKINPGFEVDVSYYCKGAVKGYSINDLIKFIEDVYNGIDELKGERDEICVLMNFSTDGFNTKRVVDFICERSNLIS